MDDIDAMFSDLLGEMDLLTQSLGVETIPPLSPSTSSKELDFQFKDLNAQCLNSLEDNDLDALMADLVADINETEETLRAQGTISNQSSLPPPPPDYSFLAPASYSLPVPPENTSSSGTLPAPKARAPSPKPLPPPGPTKPLTQEEIEAQAKSDKIKLALEKLKEAKVKKLVIKVTMTDGSSKTLMVDETQTVRDILDNLFEKTHCDCNIDWTLFECSSDLQIERGFEDHENLVELLSQWTRDSENKIIFVERKEKYAVFKNPQNFYLGKKEKKEMKDKDKESLLEDSFCGTSLIVPDLEGALYLKEDGKRSWKRRYFLLRASGIYYVPKGKTKTSRDLACFIQFENVNVYYGTDYKNKYKAPTDFCFVLKHPQIQKESQYVKYLCCDDKAMMELWVTGIRIAKYGKTLYDNYKIAVQKAGLASRWSNLSIVDPITSSVPSKGAVHANGHAAQATTQVTPLNKAFSDAWKNSETKDNTGSDLSYLPPPPPPEEQLPPPPPDPVMLPPMGGTCQPPLFLPRSPNTNRSEQMHFPPPPEDNLPPPSPDFTEPPPDFLPPPPPRMAANSGGGGGGPAPPPPPPPPPPAANPAPALKKVGPPPPKRTTPSAASTGGGQQDFMSELMKAMQKKHQQ
ncbi:amyloid beta A4 precursor protein-binding family B member 1-interacting protein [Amia ocellicauda]|uniref:amyloid beta A4 precursor protein-binding family B member 1-interacting protein n=1 Tax=Amia ocellicauda TaxID=2972642 RepID=UPI0034647928